MAATDPSAAASSPVEPDERVRVTPRAARWRLAGCRNGPEASHLLLLELAAGHELFGQAYAAALAERCRWREFGGSCVQT